MNTDNLGISGSGIGGPNDPYGHHHLIQQHHLLPSHHAAHPSSLYCSSSNAYTELFSPFSTDFVASHDPAANTGVPTDYLAAQNSLDYAMSHHHVHHPSHHPHQIASSSNGERTPSSVGTGITGSDSSPSHSYGTSSGYSSSIDYYNTPVHTAKVSVNNSTANNSSTTTTNNNNNNSNSNNTAATNASSHSPYDGTSTASTSSPPHSTGYLNTTVKQETMMPAPFALDPHCSNYGIASYLLSIHCFLNN
jgi:hypothetical protein